MEDKYILQQALRIAAVYHKGQKRKGSDVPYIIHPVEVGMILQENGAGIDLVVAGLLHDILEDTEMTEEKLVELFDEEIVRLVKGASEKLVARDQTPWEERKQHTIDSLKTADRDIKLITCADKLSNCRSMAIDYKKVGDKLWTRFSRGYEKQKWYYENVLVSLEDLQGESMYKEFQEIVKSLFC
ncbi:MAG: HD domain-containing protein [bacterium]